ncbi:hypothetical protein UF64_17495 [Thalassospira sp. HJ]|nr:hypothetical protein UF64_17495 [Thalassospira sp. HJ]
MCLYFVVGGGKVGDFSRVLRKYKKRSEQELRSIQNFKTTAKVCALVIIPLFAAVILAFKDDMISLNANMFWIIVALILVMQVVVSSFVFNDGHVSSLIHYDVEDICQRYELLLEQKNKVEVSLDRNVLIFFWMRSSLSMIDKYIEKKYNDSIGLNRMIDESLASVIWNSHDVFEFEAGEKWSFSVYLYDSSSDCLRPVWRSCAKNHPSDGMGREWKSGFGHVGMTFQKATAQIEGATITQNANSQDISNAMCVPNEHTKDYDTATYVSYVSCPIMNKHNSEQPYGVLIGSSDVVGRFDSSNCLVVEAAAAVVGILVERAGENPLLDIDKLIPSR